MQEVPDWLHFDLEDVRADRVEHGRPWQEFIRVPDLFTGLYEIPAGGEDGQSPHDADEVYYVVAGRATAVVEGDRIDTGVRPATSRRACPDRSEPATGRPAPHARAGPPRPVRPSWPE